MKINSFMNQYQVSKTLQFSLIPQGMTAQNFEMYHMLDTDEKRAADYARMKEIMDRYHRAFIQQVLDGIKTDTNIQSQIKAYASSYMEKEKEQKKVEKAAKDLRTSISEAFTSHTEPFKQEDFIKTVLPQFVKNHPEEAEIVQSFSGFTTYFRGFYANRKNMYTNKGHATEIAFRIVDQNLPRYLDNCRIAGEVLADLPKENIDALTMSVGAALHMNPVCIFDVEYFINTMSQSGIDDYNQILGGYTDKDGSKIQGLNEYINLHNQQTGARIPKLKPLYKQILSDRTTLSFIPEQFESDQEVLTAIRRFYLDPLPESDLCIEKIIENVKLLLCRLASYDGNKVYISTWSEVSAVSQQMLGSRKAILLALEDAYDQSHKKPKGNIEKYNEKREKYINSIASFSLAQLQSYIPADEDGTVKSTLAYVAEKATRLAENVRSAYKAAEPLLTGSYISAKKLNSSDKDAELIKRFLDSMMDFRRFANAFAGSGKEAEKDERFYGEYTSWMEQLESMMPLYNKTRNYITQKPYSTEKIKLNFDNVQLLNGWDVNKETDCSGILLEKGGRYFLGIMRKDARHSFESIPQPKNGEPAYRKIVYKQIPKASQYLSSKQILPQHPSKEIKRILEKKGNKQPLTKAETVAMIDYLSNDFLVNYKKILDERGKNYFHFTFKEPEAYHSLEEFYEDVDRQAYAIQYRDVPDSYIDSLVNEGKLFLFMIYNKDFSEYSKGAPNMHTLYFRMLFDERNLENPVFKLNGNAEVFYRKPSLSLSETTVHPAGMAIENKNPDNRKRESVFDYDIIKDRRYTRPQFSLHVPITVNMRQSKDMPQRDLNVCVRQALRKENGHYIIGIDRGERNLLYICVIDGCGRIVEQHSLNSIINEYNGQSHTTDYHKLLSAREDQRSSARVNWKRIDSIKDLKEGYLSQVIHKICELVVKYDAIIAMENLNPRFKADRTAKVEKAVYQKFEKMLITKLNFLADKHADPFENGGLMHAYQLTAPVQSLTDFGNQNGFIFYVPAWMTSKIDPTTGFTDLMDPRYTNVEAAKAFIRRFERIYDSGAENGFAFEFDYDKFPKGCTDYVKRWTIYTHGHRIRAHRNPDRNNAWETETVNLTESMSKLFQDFHIDTGVDDLRDQICGIGEKRFFDELIHLIRLILQMRNSDAKTGDDYILSPVKNGQGKFYDSRDYAGRPDAEFPVDADANGAYHIAKKALWAIGRIRACPEDDLPKVKLSITNREWLEYVQRGGSCI